MKREPIYPKPAPPYGTPREIHPATGPDVEGDEAQRLAQQYVPHVAVGGRQAEVSALAQAIRDYGKRQLALGLSGERQANATKELAVLRAERLRGEVATLQEKLRQAERERDDAVKGIPPRPLVDTITNRYRERAHGAEIREREALARAEKAEAALEAAKAHAMRQGESYRKIIDDIEAERDSLRAALEVERGKASPVSREEANELQDILRTLTPSGTALKTSARELVAAWEKGKSELAAEREAHAQTQDRDGKLLRDFAGYCTASDKRISDLEGALREGSTLVKYLVQPLASTPTMNARVETFKASAEALLSQLPEPSGEEKA